MSQELLRYRIALNLIPGIGDVLIKNLISYCGSEEAVFKESENKLQKIPGIGQHLAKQIKGFKNFERAEKEIKFIEKHQIKPLFYLEAGYPKRLLEFMDAPNLLYSLGGHELNNRKVVAIVGTRKASEYGRQFTEKLIAVLKDKNVLVVSGLAAGIDGMAHKYALEAGLETTGVLAHGFDRMYPAQHKLLAAKMIKQGGLLTEFPSETIPDKENFPKRNRIVAGMCDALVLVETAIKGGSRITAEIANSYNKNVFCVPGRTTDYYSKGCNYLIQSNKANMLCEPADLLDYMNWNDKIVKGNAKKQLQLFESLPSHEQELLHFIREKVKISIDQMAFELQTDPGILALKLLELEFAGYVRSLPGKMYELS